MEIREALDSDFDDVIAVVREAFGQDDESHLVRNLISDQSAKPVLSMLAYKDNKAVGHILFTKARLDPESNTTIYLLAPLAVISRYQHQGIGAALIEAGLKKLIEWKVDLVFVLGYPGYYSRFGFEPAGVKGFEATYPIAEENADAWMVFALRPNAEKDCCGKVICADQLHKPEYWKE